METGPTSLKDKVIAVVAMRVVALLMAGAMFLGGRLVDRYSRVYGYQDIGTLLVTQDVAPGDDVSIHVGAAGTLREIRARVDSVIGSHAFAGPPLLATLAQNLLERTGALSEPHVRVEILKLATIGDMISGDSERALSRTDAIAAIAGGTNEPPAPTIRWSPMIARSSKCYALLFGFAAARVSPTPALRSACSRRTNRHSWAEGATTADSQSPRAVSPFRGRLSACST